MEFMKRLGHYDDVLEHGSFTSGDAFQGSSGDNKWTFIDVASNDYLNNQIQAYFVLPYSPRIAACVALGLTNLSPGDDSIDWSTNTFTASPPPNAALMSQIWPKFKNSFMPEWLNTQQPRLQELCKLHNTTAAQRVDGVLGTELYWHRLQSPSPSPNWEPSSLLALAGFLSPNLATYPEVSLCVLNTDSHTEPAGLPPSSSNSIPPPNVPSNSRPNKQKQNQQSPSAINSRKEKNKKHAKKKKKLVRQEEAEANRLLYGNFVHPEVRAKHTGCSTTVATDVETENLKAASSGYVGVRSRPSLCQYMLEELVGPNSLGLHLVTNRGPEARHIVDNSNRIVGVYAGQLNNPDWIEQLARSTTLLEKACAEGDFTVDKSHHSRGDFPTLASGVAHRGGTKGPCNQRPSQKNNAALVNELLTVFECLAIHASDTANLPFGLCAVTALGNFDATKGGHLVLWDLGLVIEFPPSSTILIPSAVIEHSNIPIQEHETRYSFTQYSSGGLFQWAEYGMQNNKDFFKGMLNEELQKVKSDDAQRWKFGLSLFSTYKELRNMGAGIG
ncbi:hypothetical protein DXG01_002553, partial [Tephrocybe rancida]